MVETWQLCSSCNDVMRAQSNNRSHSGPFLNNNKSRCVQQSIPVDPRRPVNGSGHVLVDFYRRHHLSRKTIAGAFKDWTFFLFLFFFQFSFSISVAFPSRFDLTLLCLFCLGFFNLSYQLNPLSSWPYFLPWSLTDSV